MTDDTESLRALGQRVQQLEDRLAIYQLLATYGPGVDRRRVGRLRAERIASWMGAKSRVTCLPRASGRRLRPRWPVDAPACETPNSAPTGTERVVIMQPIPFDSRSTADDVVARLDLKGRTILVTGCNSGIGFETIRALSTRGAHIIGLARSLQAAREACGRLGPSASATAVACDLGDLACVVAAANTVRALGRPLDAIVCNAGVMCPPSLEVRYGVELQFLVNHIGHFLLVNHLLDGVPDRTGRIVIVSSSASTEFAPKEGIMFDNLDGSRFYKPFTFYGQ